MLQAHTAPSPAPSAIGASAEAWFRDQPPRMLDVGDAQLATWRVGDGPDLVFIHGWPLHAATFRAIVPALSAHYTCHLLDLPASGRSRLAAGAQPNFKAHALAVRRAVDALGLERYAIFAHDSGGLIARFVAAEDPRVTSMVLLGTEISGHRVFLIRLLAMLARLPFGAFLLRLSLALPIMRKSALGFGPAFAHLDHMDGDFHTLFIAPLLASNAEAARQLSVLRTIDWTWLDDLPRLHARIAIPTQLVWGSDDGFFPAARARRMASEFARPAEFVEIAGGKTFLHEDMPGVLLKQVLPFLRAHARGGVQ